MFKLYGKKPRCLWCGKANKENYKEIVMSIRYAKPPQEKTIVCSEECEKKALDACKFIERSIPLFLILLGLGFILGVSGIFTSMLGKEFSFISTIGIIILGITFIIFPFVTPQTVKIFGLRKGMIWGRIGGITLLLLGMVISLYLIINLPGQQIEDTDKLKQECCLECHNIFTNLPIDVGVEAKCGEVGKLSEKCKNYFKHNPTTLAECVQIISDEEKINAVFSTYLFAEENCDINLANSIITEKSKEIMHYTCSNMADERKCHVNKTYKVLTKGDTAIIHFDDFSHKTGWPFFFAKENGEWKIDFYKMAFGIAMGGSGCDTGWSWRNEEIKNEFCSYFKEGECPEK